MTCALFGVFALVTGVITILFGWAIVLLAGHAEPAALDTWWTVLEPVGSLGEWSLAAAGGAYLVWLYCAVRIVSNGARGPTLVTPAAAVFFALALLPYSVMRDLHSRVAPEDRSLGGGLVRTWWAAWVTMLAFSVTASWIVASDPHLAMDPELLAAGSCAWGLAITISTVLTAWLVGVISVGEGETAPQVGRSAAAIPSMSRRQPPKDASPEGGR